MSAVMGEMVFCRGCGKDIHKTARHCPQCGAVQTDGSGKSKTVAALLAFFLGGLGIHRFYLGQWWGIFYLLFCWTFIPGLISLIETLVFLLTSDAKWDAKYNEGRPYGGGTSTAVVAVLAIVGVFVFIAIVGILAAIAIPAYHDYTIRAKMNAIVADADRLTAAVGDSIETNGAVPTDVKSLGVTLSAPDIRNVAIDPSSGVISLTMGLPSLDGQKLLLIPALDGSKKVTWTCGSEEIKQRYLPAKCRQQKKERDE